MLLLSLSKMPWGLQTLFESEHRVHRTTRDGVNTENELQTTSKDKESGRAFSRQQRHGEWTVLRSQISAQEDPANWRMLEPGPGVQ